MHKPKNQVDPSEYSRKIKNRGDFRREQARLEYEAAKKEALSKTRPIDENLHLREIGSLKVQVVYQPSFEPGYVWDVREKEENGVKLYELYESELASRTTLAPGYKKVDVNSDDLLRFLKEVHSIKVSLAITPLGRHGLDGTLYGVNVYENFYRVIKLTWWEKPQDDLVKLDQVIKKHIELFKDIKDKKNVG